MVDVHGENLLCDGGFDLLVISCLEVEYRDLSNFRILYWGFTFVKHGKEVMMSLF